MSFDLETVLAPQVVCELRWLLDQEKFTQFREEGASHCYWRFDVTDYPPYQEILGILWPGKWVDVFAILLKPGGCVHAHAHKERDCAKHHIVLETCLGVVSRNGSAMDHLVMGGVYRLEPRLVHGSANLGLGDRLHLIIEVAE